MSKVYVGDTETLITLDTGAALTGATVSIKVSKPDGQFVTWPGTISGNTISYTTQAGDIDVSGNWRVQADVTIGSGHWLGETASFSVYDPFL